MVALIRQTDKTIASRCGRHDKSFLRQALRKKKKCSLLHLQLRHQFRRGRDSTYMKCIYLALTPRLLGGTEKLDEAKEGRWGVG